eukprot:747341-Hanusia_phi.AAC.4
MIHFRDRNDDGTAVTSPARAEEEKRKTVHTLTEDNIHQACVSCGQRSNRQLAILQPTTSSRETTNDALTSSVRLISSLTVCRRRSIFANLPRRYHRSRASCPSLELLKMTGFDLLLSDHAGEERCDFSWGCLQEERCGFDEHEARRCWGVRS